MQNNQAVVQNNQVAVQNNCIGLGSFDGKSTLKPIKNIQNVIIQKEVNKINKVQMVIGNKSI